MTAADVAAALRARHPGYGGQMPGPWTVIEEWRGMDVLAFSAWASKGWYARVGYEIKVSRSDLRRELLNPGKRARSVAWCNEFYFAVPAGLLTPDELAFTEPPEFQQLEAFTRDRCPERCSRRRADPHTKRPADRLTGAYHHDDPADRYRTIGEWRTCETCGGRGYMERSHVEETAPTLWVPADVGLVEVNGRGTHVRRRSPRRASSVPPLTPMELGQLVRWVSMRPDHRHHPRPAALAEATG